MSIYFEKARELGNLILASEHAIALTDASVNFNSNKESKQKMEEYKAYQASVQASIDKKAMSKDEYKIASKRLAEMAIELKKDESIAGLIYAENEFNSFVNQVMNILKLTITGASVEEENGPAGCAGCRTNNCNSCN